MKKVLFIFIVISLYYENGNTQVYNFIRTEKLPLTSVWDATTVFDQPDQASRALETLAFGEQIESSGEEAYNKVEQTNYLKVQTRSGKVGWVNNFDVIKDGVIGIMVDDGLIFRRPGTPSTVSLDYFEAGEMVVVADVSAQWVNLITKNRVKSGWIQGVDKVSIETSDVQIGALLHQVLAEPDQNTRTSLMKELLALANESDSELYPLVEQHWRELSGETTYFASTRRTEETTRGDAGGFNRLNPEETPMGIPRSFARWEKFRDPLTDEVVNRYVEVGQVYEVPERRYDSNIFYAWHKSLPIGSRLRIELPENPGFIEVEVVNHLRHDNPGIIGLSRTCIETLFGTDRPGEITIYHIK